MSHFDTPVALILFNRPERLADVVSAIRETRPRRIVAIADGPRPDRPDDVDRCRAARAVLDAI
ncbi:MAG: glycosyltransferase family 2 protein, partial [Planctomycetota bacterium]